MIDRDLIEAIKDRYTAAEICDLLNLSVDDLIDGIYTIIEENLEIFLGEMYDPN